MSRRVHFDQQNGWAEKMVTGRWEQHHGGQVDVFVTESIGERVIEGVRASGVRMIRTMADPDTKKEQTFVTELWYSAELKEPVVMKGLPAPSGFSDFELKEIDRKEPDPKLFYPPDGYKIGHY